MRHCSLQDFLFEYAPRLARDRALARRKILSERAQGCQNLGPAGIRRHLRYDRERDTIRVRRLSGRGQTASHVSAERSTGQTIHLGEILIPNLTVRRVPQLHINAELTVRGLQRGKHFVRGQRDWHSASLIAVVTPKHSLTGRRQNSVVSRNLVGSGGSTARDDNRNERCRRRVQTLSHELFLWCPAQSSQKVRRQI